jgi:hypothetical protein
MVLVKKEQVVTRDTTKTEVLVRFVIIKLLMGFVLLA